ncbi:MAG: 23S rRNA (pseudouridine(1915)-N(3))-methyltransferase RlmH [Vulcanimicrobiaceae bacterium]
MHLRLIAVGRVRTGYVAAACEEFRTRLRPYYTYDETEVRAGERSDPIGAMRLEADRILKLLNPDERVWLLEREGTQLASHELALRLSEIDGSGRLTLIVAGTYGADERLHRRANFIWSLSRLTLLHEWARMLVLEQLYPAAKITRNEPYHH